MFVTSAPVGGRRKTIPCLPKAVLVGRHLNILIMEEHTIYDDDKKGFTKVFSGKDIEHVNPIEYYADWEMRKSLSLERAMLNQKNPIITAFISDEFFEKRAKQKWDERLAQINATQVPENFITLLNSTS